MKFSKERCKEILVILLLSHPPSARVKQSRKFFLSADFFAASDLLPTAIWSEEERV